MVSVRGAGLVVTVGNGISPHLGVWVAEAEDLGWSRLHVETHGSGVRGIVKMLIQAVVARLTVVRAARERTVVQAHGAGRAAVVATVLVSSRPTIIVHGSEVLLATQTSAVRRRLLVWVLGRSREIVVTAPSSIPAVVRLVPQARSKIRVVHPGVKWERFSEAHLERQGPLVFLSVRRMLPLYRIRELVEAFGAQAEGASLVLLRGDAPPGDVYVKEVTAEAARSPHEIRVIDRFLSAPDLVQLYGSVDIAVSTAESDQLSASVLEALAAGCVLVLSDLEAYGPVRDLPQVVLVRVGAGHEEVAEALALARGLVCELGRTSHDRELRAIAARQAFAETFGSTSRLLPID